MARFGPGKRHAHRFSASETPPGAELTSRSDTRFRLAWIARLLPPLLLASGLAGLSPGESHAQILGSQTPGTPGAIDGELRSVRPPSPPRARDPNFPAAEAAADPPVPPARFSLKRNPNTAVRRQLRSGQRRIDGFAGASPAGRTGPSRPGSAPRDPRDLTGARLQPGDPAERVPQPGRPGIDHVVAPGLPPVGLPNPRRSPREDDPYAPLGLRVGSMIIKPAIEISGGHDTNAARSGALRKGSPFWRTEGELNAGSDWSRHQLDIALRGTYTGYTALSTASRPEGDARIALRLDVSRDQTIESEIRARIDTESPSSVNLPAGATGRVPYYTMGTSLGGTHRFGRLSLNLRGSLDRSMYSEVESGGATISQDDRNVNAYALRTRLGYEITPGITPFVETTIDRRAHDRARDAAGYARDSQGLTARLGSTFELARTLTGEIGAGYTMRNYEDSRLSAMNSPIVDAALTWSISPLTALNLRATSDIAETTVAGSSGARSYRGTATLTHAFLRNFTATASFGLGRVDYDRVNRQENTLNAGLRLEYKFNRLLALRGSYAFERFTVNAPGENYRSHSVMLGMRLTP